jgi:gentisate 1,2-dioxygenase
MVAAMTSPTTHPTPQQLAHSGSLEELYQMLGSIGMGAGWAKPTPSLWAEPKQTFQPHCWSYAQAKGALDAAGRLINTELAERRNLIMQNPAEGYATSRTIVAAYQMIMPGEKARSHRTVRRCIFHGPTASAGSRTRQAVTASRPRSRSAILRSTPWRCR